MYQVRGKSLSEGDDTSRDARARDLVAKSRLQIMCR